MLKILFLGQKPLGEACFDILLKNQDIEIIGVVSNADPQSGWWGTNKIYQKCISEKLLFCDNKTKNEEEIIKLIEGKKPDYLISIQHPWILSSKILKLLHYQAFNLHMAKLPDYKGWNGFSHAILNEDTEYGVTLHWISDQLDEGDCAYEESVSIDEFDTAFSLYNKAFKVCVELFYKLLDDIGSNAVPKYPQKNGGDLYKKNSLEEFKYIPLAKLSKDSLKVIRALHFPPYSPVYTVINGIKISLTPEETLE